jgi:hypothetical protein
MNSSPEPTIIWVVGTAPDSGKTTFAAGLVRLLNKLGLPTVGFKPHGAFRLIEHVDHVLSLNPTPLGLLYGNDVVKLAAASPLTPPHLSEVVGPSYRMSISNALKQILLVREGSTLLGDREYYSAPGLSDLMLSNDFKEIGAQIGLPLANTIIRADLRWPLMIGNGSKQSAAFNFLKSLGPRAIVCEGAGSFLPSWPGMPRVNHLLLIDDGKIYFFPHTNFLCPHTLGAQNLNHTGILPNLVGKNCIESRIRLCKKADVNQSTENVLCELLHKAGILK